jgi:hypothetical protein
MGALVESATATGTTPDSALPARAGRSWNKETTIVTAKPSATGQRRSLRAWRTMDCAVWRAAFIADACVGHKYPDLADVFKAAPRRWPTRRCPRYGGQLRLVNVIARFGGAPQ